MSCIPFKSGRYWGLVSVADCYRFRGVLFEWHNYLGPVPLDKRRLEPRRTFPKGFCKAVEAWRKLPRKQREKYRI